MRASRYIVAGGLLATMSFSSCECSKDTPPIPEEAFATPRVGFKVDPTKPAAQLTKVTPVPREPEEDLEKDRESLDLAAIPEDFPDEIPIFKDAELSQVQPLANNAHNLVFETATPVTDVNQFYQDKMAASGWQVTQQFERDNHAFTTFKKDDMIMNLTIARDARNPGKQVIAIMYEKEEPLPFDEF